MNKGRFKIITSNSAAMAEKDANAFIAEQKIIYEVRFIVKKGTMGLVYIFLINHSR